MNGDKLMALLTARITYKSRRQFVFWGRGSEAKIHFERIDWKHQGTRFIIQTYDGLGKPQEGVPGLKLELDEETMQALLAVLNEMANQGSQRP